LCLAVDQRQRSQVAARMSDHELLEFGRAGAFQPLVIYEAAIIRS